MILKTLKIENIKPAPWRCNYVQKTEMTVLAQSIREHGWIYPIVVAQSSMEIIDGFHRWVCAQNDKEIFNRDMGEIPVLLTDIHVIDAMIMHIQLNRSKGSITAKGLSNLIRTITYSKKYDQKTIQSKINMSNQEFELLLDGTLLKDRKLSEHTYSRAWVPIEAPAGTVIKQADIERPPNPDR